MRFGQYAALSLALLLLPLAAMGVEFSNQGLATRIELPDGYENVTKALGGKALIALRKVEQWIPVTKDKIN